MKFRRLALLALVLAMGSCGSDGGSSGTGITTAQGNVVAIEAASRPGGSRGSTSGGARASMIALPAAADLGGIRVSVEGTDVSGETDGSGAFRVRGAYDSIVTLLFERASDGIEARITVNAPAGGTLTLDDVRLDTASGEAIPRAQSVSFAGLVEATDCAGGTITLVSRTSPDDGDDYVVELAGSTIEDAAGRPVACQALSPGDATELDGVVNQDGTFGQATIVVDAAS